MPHVLGEEDWLLLLRRIKSGKCTPFLGAGACHGVLPLGADIAEDWAKEYAYPLQDFHDLARVAQFLAVRGDAMAPKEDIVERFRKAAPPQFQDSGEPHRILASLPLPVYITTNYDDFMVRALKAQQKLPQQELCRWNNFINWPPSAFANPDFVPDVVTPVVFHLHGHLGLPESLVLTEDDYLDFLVNWSRDQDLVPMRIQEAMAGSSLLFLGYGIADWDFRVVFRGLVGYLNRSIQRKHVSVQLVPGESTLSDEQKEQAQEYLDRYFGKLEIRIYWGTCREFATELAGRWEQFRGSS